MAGSEKLKWQQNQYSLPTYPYTPPAGNDVITLVFQREHVVPFTKAPSLFRECFTRALFNSLCQSYFKQMKKETKTNNHFLFESWETNQKETNVTYVEGLACFTRKCLWRQYSGHYHHTIRDNKEKKPSGKFFVLFIVLLVSFAVNLLARLTL